MILSVFVRDGRWRVLAGLGLATGVAAVQGSASAHTGPGKYTGSCSPHGAAGSKSGTVFSNCVWDRRYSSKKGTYSNNWTRDIACTAGTGCANALCGAGHSVVGGYTSQGCFEGNSCDTSSTFQHGIPAVFSLVCN